MRRTILLLLVWVCGMAALTHADTTSSEKRVLFIVETSRETKMSSAAGQKLVTTLVESGMGGLLADGDSFGLWTFNQNVYIGRYPMQRWTAAESQDLARGVLNYLKALPNEKQPHIEPVLPPLASVIRHSPAVMIVMVTSGKTPMMGSQFDTEINAYYKENLREFQKKKIPFVTMFAARDGKIKRYSVSSAVGEVKIPKLPPEEKKPEPPPVAVTNAPPIAPPPVEKKADKALVITKSGVVQAPVAQADALAAASAKTAAPEARPKVEPATEPPKTETPVPPPLSAVVISSEENKFVVTPKPASPPPAVKPQITNAAPKVEPTNNVAEPAENKTPVASPETLKTEPVTGQTAAESQETKVAPVVSPPAPAVVAAKAEVKQTPVAAPAPAPAAVAVAPVVPANNAVAANPPPTAPEKPAPVVARNSEAVMRETIAAESRPATPAIAAEKLQPTTPATSPTPQIAAATPQPDAGNRYFIIGLILTAVAVVLAFFVGRATVRRNNSSLITHWAEHEKK